MTNSRNEIFDRVTVDHVLRTGTRVCWRLQPSFSAPLPYTFQLQIGETCLAEADDWTDIGDPAEDVICLFDDGEQRDFSVVPSTNYRIKLVTGDAQTYYSPAVPYWGRVNRIDWIRARAIIRRDVVRNRVRAGTPGWLFKRRKRTAPVTDTTVVDFLTSEVINTQNTEGVGTDRIGGYFAPAPFLIVMEPGDRYPRRDAQGGSIDDTACFGRALAYPEVEHNDVWVTATGDARYAIHRVTTVAMIRDTPLAVLVELRRLAATDPVYELPLPETPPLQTLGREEF